MNKVLGIAGLLVAIVVITAVFSPTFLTAYNLQNIIRWTALFGILSIGAAFVIITGGIDLSVGSIVGLIGCLMPLLFVTFGWPAWLMLVAVLAVAAAIGLGHGLLITKLRLQPFVVTLCGLLLYRGIARYITGDKTLGFGSAFDDSLRLAAVGKPFSFAFLILIAGIAIAGLSAILLARDIRAERESGASPIAWRIAIIFLGCLLILIGSSRFWFGWEMNEAQSWLSGRRLEIDARGIAMPGMLAWWAGFAMFIPACAILVVSAVARSAKRITLPLASLLIGLGVAALAAVAIRSEWGILASLPTWTVYLIFAIGALGFAFGWMEFSRRVWTSGGVVTRLSLAGTTIGGLMWLVGLTPILTVLIPMPFLVLLAIAVVSAVLLNHTAWGRHLLALGNNELAARYSGIDTDRLKIAAYVISAVLAGVAGILFALDVNVIQPASHGNFYELYAIAAAVLGGCSLRGGEGSIVGVVIGAAVMRILYNSINLLGIPTQLEFAIIGGVILIGVIIDEVVRRVVSRRRTRETSKRQNVETST